LSDELKKVVDRVRSAAPRGKVTKSNRTLSLSEPQFRTFQAYCVSKGMTTSEVVDQLISAFMKQSDADVATDAAG
jgi:hypothetical protein